MNNNIQIISAEAKEWSKAPSGNSDIPERGTDLTVTVDQWPADFTPSHIIYNKRKSLSAAITDTVDGHPVITGRIVRSSYRLPKTSETVSKSDRLVFTTNDGEEGFVEITKWKDSKK